MLSAMRSHQRSMETAASPQAIWRIWSDTSTWGEWNPNVSSMELEGPFATGTAGIMRTKAGRAHRMQLTSVEPGRSFVLETSVLPLTHFAFRCEVAPTGQGKSRISQSLTMSGPLAPVFSPMAGERIAESFVPLLAGLASKAERAPTA